MTEILENRHYPEGGYSEAELALVRRLAARHAVGKTALLDINPEKYSAQGTFRMDGQRLGVGAVFKFGEELEPRFADVKGSLKDKEQIDQMGELLESGQNVAILTPHGPLSDIGVASAANILELQDRGYNFRTATIVSQTLQMLAFELKEKQVPAVDMLGYIYDHIYFNRPRTQHVEEAFAKHTGDDRAAAFNTPMLKDLLKQQAEGGLLLTIAPSGTTDKQEGDDYKLAPLAPATMQLMKHRKLWVQPLAVRLAGTDPFAFEFVGEPRKIRADDDAHAVMHELAGMLSDELPDYNYVYDDPRTAVEVAG